MLKTPQIVVVMQALAESNLKTTQKALIGRKKAGPPKNTFVLIMQRGYIIYVDFFAPNIADFINTLNLV